MLQKKETTMGKNKASIITYQTQIMMRKQRGPESQVWGIGKKERS